MNSIKISKIMIVFAIILLVALPICVFCEISAQADSTQETVTTHNDDYVFFVVEDTQTPLAAAPVIAANTVSPVLWVVLATFIGVLSICYISWYMMLLHNTNTFINKMPSYLRNKRLFRGSILHPIRSMELSEELAYDVANKYITK